MAILSVRGYAKHRGTGHSTVQKAIATGRISTLPNGMIDSAVADREWKENTEVRPTGSSHRTTDEESTAVRGYTRARAIREHFAALREKLEYERLLGSLVSKDEVQVAAFNTSREFRDRMLNIPDRLAAELAAENEPARCYEILKLEITKALDDFATANT
jgi:hypothetical protein